MFNYESRLKKENNNLCNFSQGEFGENKFAYEKFFRVIHPDNCSSCTNKNCLICENAISEFFIIEQKGKEELFRDINDFLAFQKQYIAKLNYELTTDLRYSIYIFFVIDSYDTINNSLLEEIESNMEYARKRFFTANDLYEYFNKTFVQITPKNQQCLKEENSDEEKYSDVFKKWVDILQENNMLDNVLTNSREIMEEYNSNKQESEITNKIPIDVDFIVKLGVNKFRELNFKRHTEIIMKKANIIWGENGHGKSSILEAIEIGITGKMHNSNSSIDDNVMVEFNKNKVIQSSDSEYVHSYLGENWYNNQKGIIEDKYLVRLSFNEKFCTYHYLDYDILQKYILNYRDKAFSEEYILSIMNSPTILKMNRSIKNIKSRILDILKGYENCLQYVETKNQKKFSNIFKTKQLKYILEMKKYIGDYSKDLDLLCSIAHLILLSVNDTLSNNLTITYELGSVLTEIRDKLKEKLDVINSLPSLTKNGIEEIQLNIANINSIFKKIYSYSECKQIISENEEIFMETYCGDKIAVNELNKAQLISLAIAIILALRINLINAPKFIMFDEIVANFDSRRKLNFIDLLREMCLDGWQILFTTADSSSAGICRRKFSFLADDLNFLMLQRDENNNCEIVRKKYNYIPKGNIN